MKKTPDNDYIRLQHMLDAAETALSFAEGESRESLEGDEKLQFALVRAIEVLGEAATHITDDFKSEHPEIDWKPIKGMRNRLIHAYFEINLDILWYTTVQSLPNLVITLREILDDDKAGNVNDSE